jgi:hypothetical protein
LQKEKFKPLVEKALFHLNDPRLETYSHHDQEELLLAKVNTLAHHHFWQAQQADRSQWTIYLA